MSRAKRARRAARAPAPSAGAPMLTVAPCCIADPAEANALMLRLIAIVETLLADFPDEDPQALAGLVLFTSPRVNLRDLGGLSDALRGVEGVRLPSAWPAARSRVDALRACAGLGLAIAREITSQGLSDEDLAVGSAAATRAIAARASSASAVAGFWGWKGPAAA